MLFDGFFGIALHTRVDSRVDFQAVAVDVVFRAVGLGVFLDPAEERICLPHDGVFEEAVDLPSAVVLAHGLLCPQHTAQFLAEIWSDTFFMVTDLMEVKRERQGAQFVDFGLSQHSGFLHLLEHNVAALARALVLTDGIVV